MDIFRDLATCVAFELKRVSLKVAILPLRDEISLALSRYRLACSGAADTNTTDVAATAISTAAEEIMVNLLSVLS